MEGSETTQIPFAKSWCDQPLTVWVDGAVEHEADHGEGDHGLGHLGQALPILGQPAPAAEPAECPLDDRLYSLVKQVSDQRQGWVEVGWRCW